MKKKLYLFWWKQNLQRPMPNSPLSVAGRNYLDPPPPPPPRHHRYSKAKAVGKKVRAEKHRDLNVQVESLLMHYSDSC